MNQRVRSPRYPSISLPEAEALAKRLYNGDGMNAVDRAVAADHMGYSSLNGASAQALGSVAQYGLIENAGRGQTRLTSLALDLIEPHSDDERRIAVEQAAFTPTLFSALRERFSNSVPSEGALRAHLVRSNYTPAAIRSIVPAYIQTCEYAASSRRNDTAAVEISTQPNTKPRPTESDDQIESRQFTQHMPAQPAVPVTAISDHKREGVWRDIFELEEGEVVLTLPSKMSEESISDVEAWLKLVIKKVRRSSSHPSQSKTLPISVDLTSDIEH